MKLKKEHFFAFSILTMSLFFTSCGPPDPYRKGMVSLARNEKWVGPILPPDAFDPFEVCVITDHPMGLGEIVDISLQNNPLTRQSWANARSAAFDWEASKSSLYPTIELDETLNFINDKFGRGRAGATSGQGAAMVGGNVLTQTSNTPSNNSNTDNVSGYQQELVHTLTLQYLLFDFGGRDANIESARQTLFSYNWTHDRTLQQIIDSAMNAYYSFVDAQSTLKAFQENLRDAKANLDAANALFSVGLNTVVDVLQTKSAFVNSELAVEQQSGILMIAQGQLANVMGLPANQTLQIQMPPEELPFDFVHVTVEELMEKAKFSRPDLASAYAAYLQKEAALAVARSNGMPTITTNVNLQRFNFIHQPSLNSHTYSAGISLNVPIFSGFLYTNVVHSLKAQVDYAFGQVQNTESAIMLDVVTSYYNFKTAIETVRYSNEYLKYSQEAYDAAFANYKEGIGTILDPLTAQGVLANARAQWVRARTQWMTSLADLAYATGLL
jgi:outer membrane protein